MTSVSGSRRPAPRSGRSTRPSPTTWNPLTTCTWSVATPAGPRRATELVRQWWGRDPGFTLDDALALVASARCSCGAGSCAGSSPATRVTSFPNFTPNPMFSQAYLSGDGRGRALVVPRVPQRLEAAARGLPAVTTASLAGSSMAENDGYTTVDSPFGAVGLLAALRARRRARARRDRRPGGQRRLPPAAARRRVGCARRPAGRDRDRRAGGRRHPAVGPPGAPAGAPRPVGVGVPDGRAPGRALRALHPGRALRRGRGLLGRGARRQPARRLRRLDPRLGARRRADHDGVDREARR